MDESRETRKGTPPKGCLLMFASIALGATGMAVGLWVECLLLKNICYMAMIASGSIIGNVYFTNKKNNKWIQKYTVWQWVGYVLVLFALAILFTWIETKNQ